MDQDAEAHKYFDGVKIAGKSAIFEYFKLKETMGSEAAYNAILSKLQQTMTPKEYFQFMMSRESIASGGVAAASGGVAAASTAAPATAAPSAACEFPIWAALTQSQRACFMDGAGNIVAHPTEGGNKIRNRAVETLLAAFFKGAVPTKDPCPNSVPDDTLANREAAWDVLCRLMPGDQKSALRDEAFDFEVFNDPVILSTNENTYERAQLMGWFADHPAADPNGTEVTSAERANLTPNTRLKQFIDTFNLGGSPDRQAMLGGRKLTRRRKSKSARNRIRRMRRKTNKMRRKTSKPKSKR
jgi:hypothetical protein